jgi:NAD(P)-dependent dehydrogenase (short-subunit alcohol dehydrogenase family)
VRGLGGSILAMLSLLAKRCFITGAASGIGRATAIAAALEGGHLFLTDINGSALTQVVEQIRQLGGKVSAYRALDVASYPAVLQWTDEIQAEFGSMDLVMNVAGISIWGAIENLAPEHWRRTIDVNLMGPIHVLQCLVPAMIQAGRGGHVVNVSSAAGLFGLPWHAAYSASKFGLRGVSEVLRHDLKRHGIGVSLVCPGGVDTGLVDTVQIIGVDEGLPAVAALKRRFQRHAITPEKAAKAILRGVKAGRFMVFTSRDIQLGYWLQRKCAWPYEWLMRQLNDRLHKAVG